MVTAADLLRDSIKELKGQFTNFADNYQKQNIENYKQLVEIWKAIERIETKQRIMSSIYGLIGGAIPAGMVIAWIIIKGK